MSTDISNGNDQHISNDIELRELVYQSLERDGLITRLKAQLRAAVFKTIEKTSNPSGVIHTPGYDGTTGRICRALVLDWLEHSRLLYTQDIFKVETSGSNHPTPLTHNELLEQLHIDSKQNKSQPILHTLLDHSNNRSSNNNNNINSLPEHIKQSIQTKFPTEKINNMNQVREHFRSLFSSTFDSTVLDAFLNKNISSSLTSIPKFDYEQICLKWIQACAKALIPQLTAVKPTSFPAPIQPLTSRNTVNNGQTVTQARRSTSPPSDSASSTSSSENPRKGAYDFTLPTTMNASKSVIKKNSDIIPPTLRNFNSNDDEEEDTSSSIFSKRNATPAALNRLKNIDDIIRGDETPRTRTIVQKLTNNGNKDIPVEYDDESMSQSQISSIDDITVDKASPSPSAQIDFFDDL